MAFELVYFDLKARGEPVRIALHHAAVPFIDTRVTFANWPALKPSIPTGALPVLKKDGEFFAAESNALLRWAGKKSELYPADDDAALAVDEVLDICTDILTRCPSEKRLRQEFAEGQLKGLFDVLAAKAAGAGGFIAGSSLSIADLTVQFAVLDLIATGNFDHVDTNYAASWPVLVELSAKIAAHPVVQSWDAS
jgi:glutathione S-transferase